jgi:hypothetical protein
MTLLTLFPAMSATPSALGIQYGKGLTNATSTAITTAGRSLYQKRAATEVAAPRRQLNASCDQAAGFVLRRLTITNDKLNIIKANRNNVASETPKEATVGLPG